MKNYLKLVNDERQDKNVLSGKGCQFGYDICTKRDYSYCIYVDECEYDYSDCGSAQYDYCGTDED